MNNGKVKALVGVVVLSDKDQDETKAKKKLRKHFINSYQVIWFHSNMSLLMQFR